MSSQGSEQMLDRLKELSVYKAMDEDYRTGPKDRLETEANGERGRRRQEIVQEMQTLAAASNKASRVVDCVEPKGMESRLSMGGHS
jgi:hypothetical protein